MTATIASALGVAAIVALSACTPGATTPPAATSATSAAATPSPAPSAPSDVAGDPALQPEGTAADNLAYFDAVNAAVIAADADADGREFIDALAAAGFDRAAMQVTADTTTIGDPADSIQFAVLFAGECLIGQYGPKSGGYHSAVRPALGTGGCLVGATRPIDW